MTRVDSPCISVCQMDTDTGLCRGCFRTLDEIADWGVADTEQRLAILAAIEKRRADFDPWGEQLRSECER